MNAPVKFMVDRIPAYAGFGVEIRGLTPRSGSNSPCYVGSLTLHPIHEGEMIPAMMQLKTEEAQQLTDALYDAGFKPSNGGGSVGQLAATERHLADMRKVVFKKLDIKE